MIRAIAVVTTVVVVLLGVATGAADVAVQSSADGAAFVKPVHGAVISHGFGCTDVGVAPVDPACPGGHWHSGVDLAAAEGTPVYATAAGIAHVYVSAFGFGLHVVIDHGGGLQSLYGHLSLISVDEGAVVAAGQDIGEVGSTGNSTGPHLHFEFDRNGVAQDPLSLLALP
ncbi:MAG: M23 family metallopeptidase [Candidatus Dormibacteraeota bacterium]|nr:M23 family metallopeptidase [Candidatus Dormibacteraeota bacterium]